MMTSRELCEVCDRETDRAGGADDSLFLDNGTGPYCLECWQPLRMEELEAERDEAMATIERVRGLIDSVGLPSRRVCDRDIGYYHAMCTVRAVINPKTGEGE